MKNALFYDTETTGLPLWSEPSEHPGQPHIVQLAAKLVDVDSQKVVAAIDLIALPDGWEIPAETAAIHGITTEYASAVGVPERQILELLWNLWCASAVRIGHNESFDARIVRIAAKRFMDPLIDPAMTLPSDTWKAGASLCTADMATPLCALPPTEKMRAVGRHHYKKPNLGEAYRHFTGKTLEGAHSAAVDVDACMAVYFAIQSLPQKEPAL